MVLRDYNVPVTSCSDEGLTLKTSAFKLFTEANLRYELSSYYPNIS